MTDTPRPHLSLVSVVDQPEADALAAHYAAASRAQMRVMTPVTLTRALVALMEQLRQWAALNDSVAERRGVLPRSLFSRRLRYAARCSCGRLATGHFAIRRRGELLLRLTGKCDICWARGRVQTRWYNAFTARQALVRRNLERGELCKQMLDWVWATEQARADMTWRGPPDPPGPPTGGGTPRRRRVSVDLLESVA
jgi:hypothetical protein